MNRKREFGDFEENPNMENSFSKRNDRLLVLHNDDVHDFEYVIESLIEVCNHEPVQAEQCTFLVHYKGSCDVKRGKYNQLKEMYDRLLEKELTVSLN